MVSYSTSRKFWWVVKGRENNRDFYYAASNAPTKNRAIQFHEDSLGITWKEARERGDRLVRVRISLI